MKRVLILLMCFIIPATSFAAGAESAIGGLINSTKKNPNAKIGVTDFASGNFSIPGRHYTTVDIVESGIEGFLGDCLDYCITGVCVRLLISWKSIKIIFTPRVRHNVPDFISNTFDESGEEPWKEWAALLSDAESEIMETVLALANIEGGKTIVTEHGYYEDMMDDRFKEADVIGHPMTYVNNMLAGRKSWLIGGIADIDIIKECIFAGGSVFTCLGAGGGWFGGDNGLSFDGIFEKFGSWDFASSFLNNKMIADALGIGEAYKIMNKFASAQKFLTKVNEIKSLVGGGGFGVSIDVDHYLCKTDIKGFVPYYMSRLDAVNWRGLADFMVPEKVADKLRSVTGGAINPGDYGADIARYDSVLSCLVQSVSLGYTGNTCFVGGNAITQWGDIYPRTGFVMQPNDYKASAVISERAMDVLLNGGKLAKVAGGFDGRIRIPVTKTNGRKGIWQRLHPEVDTCEDSIRSRKKGYTATIYNQDIPSLSSLLSNPKSAARSVAKTVYSDVDTHEYGNHAWVYWRQYGCCLCDKGSKIGQFSIPEICLNDL